MTDERHPSCHRCEKAGFACEGFQHPLRIILDPTCARDVQARETATQGVGRQAPKAATHQESPTVTKCEPIVAPRRIVWRACVPPAELDMSPFQENMQSTFLVVNFISQVEFGRKSVLVVWEDMSSTEYPSRRALELAFFGRFHQRSDMCEAGSRWYGKALCKLAKDLSDPQEMWSMVLLRSAILLTMYEVSLTSLCAGVWLQQFPEAISLTLSNHQKNLA